MCDYNYKEIKDTIQKKYAAIKLGFDIISREGMNADRFAKMYKIVEQLGEALNFLPYDIEQDKEQENK